MPFSQEQFFEVFVKYNSFVFPFQILLFIAGSFCLSLILLKSKSAAKTVSYFLVLLWLWNGIVYHLYFFSEINKAAIAFGVLFILQAAFFLIEFVVKKQLFFSYENKFDMITGYFLVIFGLVIYPAIGLLLGNDINRTILLGLPCPTVIYTFGIIVLSRKNYTLYKLIIPVIWAFIGFSAAIKFGVYQDVMLPVSAVISLVLFYRERI
ncbi:MAG: hypothetical protein HY959_04900 [Ignavibacteriae bacterium]|nr:hypothetical protein [Ignavibacteriota bacterium]